MNRRGVAATVVGLVFILGGCTMVGPDFVKPEAHVADQWTDMEGRGLTRGVADYSAWWKMFNDPVLDQIIEKTYAQNLTLQVAGLRILQARAQLGIATGNLYPQQQLISGEYAANQVSENMGTPVFDRQYQSLGLGFDAAWEMDIWGKFRRSVEFGMAGLEASIASYDDILVSVTAEAARAYIQIRTLEERLAIARANVSIQERTLAISEARFEGGEVSRLDVTQARSQLRNSQALVPALESALRQTRNALAILLGILPGELEDMMENDGSVPTVTGDVVISLPAELLRRRPDIRLAELRVAAQSPRIGIAKADLYPHFTLFGSIGLQATNANFPGEENSFSDFFNDKSMFWKAGPAFSWDIFNYGRIRNRVRVEDAVFQQTVVDYRNSVIKAQAEVEEVMVAFLRIRDEEGYLADSVDNAKESVNLSLLQYEEGLIDFLRVLDTQRFLSAQSDRLSETSGRVSTNLVALYKAFGGGWEMRIGKEVVDADIREEMRSRTNWGGLLDTENVRLADPSEETEEPDLWRWPDW